MHDNSLYDTLGCPRTASADDLKKAWKKLARKLHPDLHPDDPEAEDCFKRASAAFEVLSNPEKRALYDQFGAASLRSGFDACHARSAGTSGFGGMGGIDLDELLRSAFGRQSAPGPRRGADVEASVQIDFRTAALGGSQVIHLTRHDGARDHLKVKIPAGIDEGQRIRLAGKGHPGARGGPTGDLHVRVTVAEDPIFRRKGRDLEIELPVTVGEALLGARVEVPTLTGRVTLSVPPGSQTGRKLRMGGKGITDRAGLSGDLFAIIRVVVPEVGPEEARAAAEALDALYGGPVRAGLAA